MRGNKHKKKIASVQKQAQRLAAAAKTEVNSTTDGPAVALTGTRVDDSTDQVLSH